jgi:hypothetical protein
MTKFDSLLKNILCALALSLVGAFSHAAEPLKIGSLSKGTVVALLDRDGSWWKIRAGRQSGFVAARYVSVITDTETLKPGAIVVRGRDVIGQMAAFLRKPAEKAYSTTGRCRFTTTSPNTPIDLPIFPIHCCA